MSNGNYTGCPDKILSSVVSCDRASRATYQSELTVVEGQQGKLN